MPSTDKAIQSAAATPAPRHFLSNAERSELQRQGAKAAARGEASGTNPLCHPHNRPAVTGESAVKWLQRSDAWVQGHEAQSTVQQDAKQPASPGNGQHACIAE